MPGLYIYSFEDQAVKHRMTTATVQEKDWNDSTDVYCRKQMPAAAETKHGFQARNLGRKQALVNRWQQQLIAVAAS